MAGWPCSGCIAEAGLNCRPPATLRQGQAREQLGGGAPLAVPEPQDWAEQEFGSAPLGDQRLNQRLRTLAQDFYARPGASLPQACQSRAKTKAAYRFLEHAETEMQVLLEPHYAATVQRLGGRRWCWPCKTLPV